MNFTFVSKYNIHNFVQSYKYLWTHLISNPQLSSEKDLQPGLFIMRIRGEHDLLRGEQREQNTEIVREGKNVCFTNPPQKAKFYSGANSHCTTYINTTIFSKSKYFPGCCLGVESWVIHIVFSAFVTYFFQQLTVKIHDIDNRDTYTMLWLYYVKSTTIFHCRFSAYTKETFFLLQINNYKSLLIKYLRN